VGPGSSDALVLMVGFGSSGLQVCSAQSICRSDVGFILAAGLLVGPLSNYYQVVKHFDLYVNGPVTNLSLWPRATYVR
jgi:hypothetical protein